MNDNLAGLSALLLVAEKQSFTAAAAELRVTRSALSQTIRALEDRVGVRLLQRTTRSVRLTEEGARFVERVRPALGEVRRAFAALEDSRGTPAGQLRLSVPRFAFAYVLRPALAPFLAAYPAITVELSIDDGVPGLVREGFDAGIRLREAIGREMIAVRVSDDESMAVVGSPGYFATHGKPGHPRELAGHECINYRHSPGEPVYRWEFTETTRAGRTCHPSSRRWWSSCGGRRGAASASPSSHGAQRRSTELRPTVCLSHARSRTRSRSWPGRRNPTGS